MRIFFTSDHHFNQNSFYRRSEKFGYQMRPNWPSAEEADQEIIARHNSVVPKENSIVYFLCDVSANATGLAKVDQMNGKYKYLILGNHDSKFGGRKLLNYFDEVYGLYELLISGKYKLMLSHAPIKKGELICRRAINAHGHTHHDFYDTDYYINCCIDYFENDYKPVELNLPNIIKQFEYTYGD